MALSVDRGREDSGDRTRSPTCTRLRPAIQLWWRLHPRPGGFSRTRYESHFALPGAEQGEGELATSAGFGIQIEVSFSTTASYSDAFYFSVYNTGSRTYAFSAYVQGGSNSESGMIVYLWQDD
jgi:hypothetical protein